MKDGAAADCSNRLLCVPLSGNAVGDCGTPVDRRPFLKPTRRTFGRRPLRWPLQTRNPRSGGTTTSVRPGCFPVKRGRASRGGLILDHPPAISNRTPIGFLQTTDLLRTTLIFYSFVPNHSTPR